MAARKKKTARKKTARTKATRKKAAKRELIDTGTDKRFVRRNARGTSFVESDGAFWHTAPKARVGRSLAADRRRKAKTKVTAGQGDRGDRA